MMQKDLRLHAFKTKLTQEVKPLDHLKRRKIDLFKGQFGERFISLKWSGRMPASFMRSNAIGFLFMGPYQVTGLCQQASNLRRPQRQHPTRNCQRSGRNVNCVIFYYRRFDWKILRILNWIRVYAENLVNAPKSHKIVYSPMHTIWVITRLA